MQQFTLKFIMLGDAGTGKTCLSARFIKDNFNEEYTTTDRLQFSTKEFSFKHFRIKAQIWDTAGKNRLEGMTRAYFKDAVGAVLVFNVHSQESFDDIQKIWIPQVAAFGQPTMPMILVANKVDGGSAPARVVSSADGIALANEHSCSYVEVSALSDYNVDAMFRRIIFSVGNIIPGVRAAMNIDKLPLGWLPLLTDNDEMKYCNYWTGETTGDEPTEPAATHENGKNESDAFVQLKMTFRDSFCSKLMMNDANNNETDRMSGYISNPDSYRSNPGTFSDIQSKSESPGGGVGCGEQCIIS